MTLGSGLNAPDWLTATPIAHRGLHDKAKGRIENSLSAARAAIHHGFAIECDVELSSDGEAMVFHDHLLERLTGEAGRVNHRTARELQSLKLLGSSDTIPTLPEFLALVDGQVPIICEIKSHFNGDHRIALRASEIARNYKGPLAFKSFDPQQLVALREAKSPRPLGFIGECVYDDPEWNFLSPQQKADLIGLAHYAATKPDFLSWWIRDLPNAASVLYRQALNLPVMTWTIRTPEQRAKAALHADQMVFEGFMP